MDVRTTSNYSIKRVMTFTPSSHEARPTVYVMSIYRVVGDIFTKKPEKPNRICTAAAFLVAFVLQ